MSKMLLGKAPGMFRTTFNPIEPGPLRHGFQMTEADRSKSESNRPQIHGSWREREEPERQDAEEDLQLRDLMENIKRYIRNIDIGSL